MTSVPLEEASLQLSQLIRAAIDGEEVVITQNDHPVVKLMTLTQPEPAQKERPHPKFGSGKGLFWMSPDFDEPLEDFKEYME